MTSPVRTNLAPQEKTLYDNLGKLSMAALFKKVWPRRNGVDLREKAMRLGAVANRINRKMAVMDRGSDRKRKIVAVEGVLTLQSKTKKPRATATK